MATAPFPSPTSKWHTTTYPSISPTRPELSAKGKTVLVTGGGSGIGAETARSFAQAGASRIALLGRREQPLFDTKASIEKAFPHVEVFIAATDITKRNEVDAAFSSFISEGKPKLDILISNAAMVGPQESVNDVDAEKFLESVQQNLSGAMYVAKAFLQYAASDAVVIETNSSAAHVNFGPIFAAYSVAKMAVFRMWDSLACGNPEMNIFHIQPGVIDTAMNQEVGGVKAMGFADDGSFNVWLASPEARFLKGRFLWTNWDVDELKARAKEIEAGTKFEIGLSGWPFQDGKWKTNWNA